MKIIEPSAELWIPKDNVSHVARCARVCYDSKGENDEGLYKALKKNHHWSMFRHETHYFMIPTPSKIDDMCKTLIDIHGGEPWFDWVYDANNYLCIVTNGNWCLDNESTYERMKEYEVNMYQFEDLHLEEPGILNMMRYTFCLTTQISTSRELNRVSPNSISERSTRYVDESEGIICRPHWLTDRMIEAYDDLVAQEYNLEPDEMLGVEYLNSCSNSFWTYKRLITRIPKEDARGLLPLDTATKVVYTYSVYEWMNIIKLRVDGVTGKPHKNAKIVIGMVKDKLSDMIN